MYLCKCTYAYTCSVACVYVCRAPKYSAYESEIQDGNMYENDKKERKKRKGKCKIYFYVCMYTYVCSVACVYVCRAPKYCAYESETFKCQQEQVKYMEESK
jgi:hypothetical protein